MRNLFKQPNLSFAMIRATCLVAAALVVLLPGQGNAQSISGQGTAARPEHQQLSQKLTTIETGLRSVRKDVTMLLRIVGGSCPGENSFVRAINTDGTIACGTVAFPPPPAVASAASSGGSGGGGSGGASASAAGSDASWSGDSGGSAASDGASGGGAVMTYALSGGYFDDMGRFIDTYVPIVLGEGPVTSCVHCDFYVDNGAGAIVHPWESFERWAAEQWAAVGVYGIY